MTNNIACNLISISFRTILGMVTVGNMMAQVVKGKVKKSDSVSTVMYKQFKQINMNTSLGQLSRMLDTDHYVLVIHGQKQCMPLHIIWSDWSPSLE